jgi:tetratricopeptide (TPR) repeat protein
MTLPKGSEKPKDAHDLTEEGNSFCSLKRYEEAIKSFNEALKIDPKYVNAWYSKGIILRDLTRYEEAIKSFNEALKIDPKCADAWLDKGVALYYDSVNNRDEALKCFDEATRLSPGYTLAWTNLVEIFWRSGKGDDAIKRIDEAVKSATEPYKLYRIKGSIYYQRGDFPNL